MAAILPPVRLRLPSAEAPLSCDRNWQNESEKINFLYWLYRLTKKWKHDHIWKCHVTMTDTSPFKEVSRDTDAYKSSDFHISNHCSTFILWNQLASFSYQHSIHGLQHYRNLGQTGLHRLCRLWQESRQIWTLFLVQKWLQLLG